jgi:hypothetical protein
MTVYFLEQFNQVGVIQVAAGRPLGDEGGGELGCVMEALGNGRVVYCQKIVFVYLRYQL